MAYEFKKTLKKMAIQFGIVCLSGAITAGINYLYSLEGTEMAIIAGIAITGLKGLENWLKHRNDF